MKKLFSYGVLAAALLVATTPASASELSLTITNGRVTLVAQDVTVRQILAEWARVGQTKIVNGEKMMGGPMTIELRDVPEAKALETLLRSAAGYVIAPRPAGRTGVSAFDAIVILATSRAPVVTASAPPTFRPPPQPIVPPMNATEEAGDQTNPNEQPVPGATSPFPGQATRPGLQPQPGQQPAAPLTSPVPGQLPPPPAGPGNPYQPQPGVRPAPGVPARPGGGGPGGGGG